MAHIVLGIGGGIAAYKSAMLLRLFTEAGHHVDVVPTRASLNFVGQATWEALSGHAVSTEVFDHVAEVRHVKIGHEAELVVVAPATADLLARAAHGLADDLLTTTLLTTTAPVVMAPAMHTEMWRHPATRANVELLRERGVLVIEPASGRLTGRDSGPGRLPEPEEIFAAAIARLEDSPAATAERRSPLGLAGLRVVVSAGGTREPLDPVRFFGNRATGRQGVALATAARDRGADVTLVAANLEVPAPDGVRLRTVTTAQELEAVMNEEARDADLVVMNAAVADFRPETRRDTKLKKTAENEEFTVKLVRNPDILHGLVSARADAGRGRQIIAGFAAETGDENGSVMEYGRAKLASKGCDLLVVNQVGETQGFGTEANTVTILRPAADPGQPAIIMETLSGSKLEVSHAVMDALAILRIEAGDAKVDR